MISRIAAVVYWIFIFISLGIAIEIFYELYRHFDELVKFSDVYPFWKVHLADLCTRFALFCFAAYYIDHKWVKHD